jgi:succinate dehydrogenase / fumarate reductase, iron-sulfur subunit
MIIRSFDQMPRATLLEALSAAQKLWRHIRVTHRAWPEMASACWSPRLKTFEIYGYEPDSGHNPHIDSYEVGAHLDQEQDRFNFNVP